MWIIIYLLPFFDNCTVYPFSSYGFWLPLWYLQTFLIDIILINNNIWILHSLDWSGYTCVNCLHLTQITSIFSFIFIFFLIENLLVLQPLIITLQDVNYYYIYVYHYFQKQHRVYQVTRHMSFFKRFIYRVVLCVTSVHTLISMWIKIA